ncbi:MAG: flagellar basal-body rod protein FlgF [Phenylobacterium sp.]|uniref:flagellar basal-body rod protein FlgF n=1 Tax=Phenylobacterium sp. TaxID=1871053 RepID=UPI002728D590|nr:flagellar basal-body rod protein FlgF [Phenylobacterium sp.]MDO8913799.1 flagellar basal-body rod protein FlgF [Phenylobacterium sp.]MDP3100518.1 flagellar basal-body rod protein FlgF [Phenylobacterium sp.]MDP3635663.1 flagellar basal-body rod protein FlgF [Phenylobacterium sp.]MDZ4053309.1 flagellar basal-body rod protein FlgF [Phenylobacterium sp.]
MDNALYVGLSRQMTLRRELDIVANNIANADTTGFKAESLMLEAAPRAPARTFGGPQPIKFVLDSGVARDFTPGSLHKTDAPFDLGIEGMGFFKVTTADGERYTRDGHFRMDDIGRITTQGGQAVLDEGGGEVTVDPQKGPVTIATDGTISQGAERIGKVAVVRFDTLSVLEKAGDNLYRNTSNAQPQAAPDARVHQGMLESSNVNTVLEITRMMDVTRAYESMAKMMDSNADLSRRSIERMGKSQ